MCHTKFECSWEKNCYTTRDSYELSECAIVLFYTVQYKKI
jgi:hypothetical protein